MPIDLTAESCLELAGLADETGKVSPESRQEPVDDDSSTVYQVQNHRLFHWTRDLLPALQRAGLDFRVVGQREWVRLLRESDPDPIRNPTFKLVDFFTAKYDNDLPGREELAFDTTRTGQKSEVVKAGFDLVGSGLVHKMVAWWKTQW